MYSLTSTVNKDYQCRNCKFCDVDGGNYYCCRYPPDFQSVNSGGETVAVYPLVGKKFWCGEFVDEDESSGVI